MDSKAIKELIEEKIVAATVIHGITEHEKVLYAKRVLECLLEEIKMLEQKGETACKVYQFKQANK